MEQRKVIVIGNSPGTYMCAIYIHTANRPVKIICTDLQLKYNLTIAPGCPGSNKEKYTEDCKNQAKNMEIPVYECNSAQISKNDQSFRIIAGSDIFEADILVLDKNIYGLPSEKNLLIIEEEMLFPEAIVAAGAGCVKAFEVKEMLAE